MPFRRACLTLLFLAVPLGGVAWAQPDFVSSDALLDAGWYKYWQVDLELDGTQRAVDLFLVGDAIYLATSDGYAYAFDAGTGVQRWVRPISREGYRVPRPGHTDEVAIFALPTYVLQVDRRTGTGVERTELDFPNGTHAVTAGPLMFLGGLEGRLHAMAVANPLFGWEVITSGPIISAPVIYENIVFFASDIGVIYAATALDKNFRWQSYTFGSVTADLVANADGLFVASRDQSLYLFDRFFGRIRWRARFSGPLYEPPVPIDDTAYQYCPADGLVAVNTGTLGVEERIRWTIPRGRYLLTEHEDRAFVLTQDESILVVDSDDATARHAISAEGMTLAAPSPDEPAIFVASPDGRVFSARPRGVPPVTADAVRAALQPPAPEAAAAAEPERLTPEVEPPALIPPSVLRDAPPLGGKSKVTREFEQQQRQTPEETESE